MRDADFERLYAEHAGALYSFLAYRTGDRMLAEDLLADTFERALVARRRRRMRGDQGKAWLFTVALNLIRDHARRADAERRALERGGGEVAEPADPLAGVADRDVVMRAVGGLSEEEQEAVALRFGADLTVPEIAKVTGEKLSTVEGRTYRALRKLRAELPEEVRD
jgi:RNA polymerase sigma factor (sigma-70 family)